MNREQIIQMAQQCGFSKTHSGVVNLWLANADDLEAFAKLVAEHCAKICEDNWHECGGQCANIIRYGDKHD